MRKRYNLRGLPVLILGCLLLISQTASAELLAGVDLGYGRTSYAQVLGGGKLNNSEWSAGIWARYDYEDLLFTGLYHGSLGLRGVNTSRHLAHVGANYRFLEEDALQVFGGLGYSLVSIRFETPEVDSGQLNTLTGHGFTGQVVVDIAISDQVRTTATVAASPWARWSHRTEASTNHDVGSGSTFFYRLEVSYHLSDDFGAELSLLGNNFGVKGDAPVGTKGSSASVNLGVTRRF